LPVHLSGQESPKSRESRVFGAWLAKTTTRPVCFYDERYSSATAEELLGQAGMTKKRRLARLDKLAAQVILTSYLEAKASGSLQERARPLEDPAA
jgi:putative Holliday junction resolvase